LLLEALMVLIATADPRLRDALLRLAAAADVPAEVARSAPSAYAAWRTARLVLVGTDLAGPLADLRPAHRPGVVLMAGDGDGPDPYRQAVDIGAQDVVTLPGREPWLVDLLAAAVEPARGRCAVVCLVGGRGGAGTSVLAATFGLTAARRGLRTLVVDGDPLGGGLDLVLGVEQVAGARWAAFTGVRGRLNAAALHASLPGLGRSGPPYDVCVLSWSRRPTADVGTAGPSRTLRGTRVPGTAEAGPVSPGAAPSSLAIVHRPRGPVVSGGHVASDPDPGEWAGAEPLSSDGLDVAMAGSVLDAAAKAFDVVVVDLPRWLGPVGTVALPLADAAFLLVPAEVRATVAADRVAAEMGRDTSATRLIVRGPAPGRLAAADIAAALGLPLAGEIEPDRRIQRGLETGSLASAVRRTQTAALCDRLLRDLGTGR
jgi:hypothetical protein